MSVVEYVANIWPKTKKDRKRKSEHFHSKHYVNQKFPFIKIFRGSENVSNYRVQGFGRIILLYKKN